MWWCHFCSIKKAIIFITQCTCMHILYRKTLISGIKCKQKRITWIKFCIFQKLLTFKTWWIYKDMFGVVLTTLLTPYHQTCSKPPLFQHGVVGSHIVPALATLASLVNQEGYYRRLSWWNICNKPTWHLHVLPTITYPHRPSW